MNESIASQQKANVKLHTGLSHPSRRLDNAGRRILDVVVALIGFVILSPAFLLLAVLIKHDSPGPIFYWGERIGRGDRIFRILKFRTMYEAAASYTGPRVTGQGDPRITPLDHWLRDTKLNELPQLWNVLKGEMSIVGPRPHALGSHAGDKLFWEVDRRYWHRHCLKPGLSGLAQVRGFRGATESESDLLNRLQSDLEYLEGWTIMRDITIILLTLRVLVHDRAF